LELPCFYVDKRLSSQLGYGNPEPNTGSAGESYRYLTLGDPKHIKIPSAG
jgi:hypothetical protein